MNVDSGIKATRAIREAISREHGNDPRRLISYYMEYQKRFAGRLRYGPGPGEPEDDPAQTSATSQTSPLSQ